MATVLGYDTIGGSITGTYSAPAQLGCKFTAAASDTFTEVMVYLRATVATSDFKVALYSDLGGVPDILLYNSGATMGSFTTTSGWFSCPLAGSIVSGNTYWIVVSCNGNFEMNYDGGSSNQTFDDYTPFPTFNNPYLSGGAIIDNYYPVVMSMYLNKVIPPVTSASITGIATLKGIQTLKF